MQHSEYVPGGAQAGIRRRLSSFYVYELLLVLMANAKL
jgi:hypothetical protein